MKRFVICLVVCLAGLGAGCGSSKELPPTTDPDAIRKEQERLRGEIPANQKDGLKAKQDALKAEQDRLRGRLPGAQKP